MATMPNYNEMLKSYAFQMKIIDIIWKLFEKRGLKEIGDIEQCLATGYILRNNIMN